MESRRRHVHGAHLYTSSNTGVVFSSAAGNLITGNGSTPGNGINEQLYLVNW